MISQKGEASKMKPGGSNESYQTHVNHPFDAAHVEGHGLNESYKDPPAHPAGRKNASYMHPLKNPDAGYSPKMAGKDPTISEERELSTKMPKGGGKVIAPNPTGKNKV
jgi:hypothetical protein